MFNYMHRSVHNIRIERLWLDFTSGVGSKWKLFFEELEYSYGLDRDNPAHIWLLHHLFLLAINIDAQNWANAWNNHKVSTPDQGQRSPHDLRWFSMLQNGTRGFEVLPQDLDTEEIDEYGIDWDDYNNSQVLSHHNEANVVDHLSHNPFVTYEPEHLNDIQVDEPGCPLSVHQLGLLHEGLRPYPSNGTMESRKIQWVRALDICIQLLQQ